MWESGKYNGFHCAGGNAFGAIFLDGRMRLRYKLNLPEMFCVPNTVADEHLKLARELDLKVLLWLLRHGGGQGIEALAQWLGKPEGELVNAVQHWIDRGILAIDNEPLTVDSKPSAKKIEEPEILPVRPSQKQILTRTSEDETLRALFGEADKILGRTIGYEGQCMLVMLHDNHGLPGDVIYMLLDYCKTLGKTNNAYIEAVGRDWGQLEVDSIEKASAQIELLKANNTLWKELCRRAGTQPSNPTATQREQFKRWTSVFDFGIEMIHLAYEEMAEHTGKPGFGKANIAYMNKILEHWQAAGVKTPEQAAAAKAQFQKKQQPKRKAAQKNNAVAGGFDKSYDLDAFVRSTMEAPVWEG